MDQSLHSAVLCAPWPEYAGFRVRLGVVGVSALLPCVGIHNAWDTVTYLTARAIRQGRGSPTREPIARPAVPAATKRQR